MMKASAAARKAKEAAAQAFTITAEECEVLSKQLDALLPDVDADVMACQQVYAVLDKDTGIVGNYEVAMVSVGRGTVFCDTLYADTVQETVQGFRGCAGKWYVPPPATMIPYGKVERTCGDGVLRVAHRAKLHPGVIAESAIKELVDDFVWRTRQFPVVDIWLMHRGGDEGQHLWAAKRRTKDKGDEKLQTCDVVSKLTQGVPSMQQWLQGWVVGRLLRHYGLTACLSHTPPTLGDHLCELSHCPTWECFLWAMLAASARLCQWIASLPRITTSRKATSTGGQCYTTQKDGMRAMGLSSIQAGNARGKDSLQTSDAAEQREAERRHRRGQGHEARRRQKIDNEKNARAETKRRRQEAGEQEAPQARAEKRQRQCPGEEEASQA